MQPKLRFKDFNGDWQHQTMRGICKINQGLQIAISERFLEPNENNYFYITNEFLRKNSKKAYYIENPTESVLCKKDDVLMTRTGNTGQVVTDVEGAFHNNFFKIKYDKSIIVKNFLVEFLRKYDTQNTILRLAGTSTIPDLNHSDFYRLKINLPTLEEQTKTANFLSKVDKKIEQLIQKNQLLNQYKKGVMQQIFSQKIRFKKEDGSDFEDWKSKNLKEVALLTSSKRVHLADYTKDGIPFFRGKEISELKSGIFPKDILYISHEQFDEIKTKYDSPKNNEILITAVGTIGNSYLINTTFEFYFKDGNLIWFKNIKEKPRFIIFLFDYFHRKISNSSIGSTQKALTIKNLNKLSFDFPTLEEQTKIANFLTAIDDKIAHTQKQLEQAQQWKKGLLQQMFV